MRSRTARINSLDLHFIEAGDPSAPLVILAHGWPESWYSWRHQLQPIADAGYRVIAPDMRGFGQTDAPEAIQDYDIHNLAADMVGLVDWAGGDPAVIVGHDWGAVVAWSSVLLHPSRFRGVAALSVPHLQRPQQSPTTIWKERYGERFYYILYHQKPGLAEAEYDADPRGLLSMLYASPDTPRHPPTISTPDRHAGGWIGRIGAPKRLPSWLTEHDLEFYVAEFTRAGFRGGLNWYRNIDRNWELMADVDPVIKVPAQFIAGSRDLVVAHMDEETVRQRMTPVVPELRSLVWLEGAGHWIQQERPGDCNQALLAFLASL